MDKEKIMGVDFSEFTGSSSLFHPVGSLLYYASAKLTDKYYIKNVYTYDTVKEEFVNKGTHLIYVLGKVNKGDYLTTCAIRGVAMTTSNPDLAFAVVEENRVPTADKSFPTIGGCRVTFI